MFLLDRYIISQFLKSFFLIVILLGFVVCVVDYTEKSDNFLEHNLSYAIILRYYSTFLPAIMSYVTPITVFITTVFMTSRLAAHTEIIAILCSGVSFLRFFLPYLIGSSLIALLSFYLLGWVVPNGNKFRIHFEQTYVKSPFFFTEEDVHFKVGEDVYLYFKHYDNHQERAYKVVLEHIKDSKLSARLSARHMSWDSLQNKWHIEDWKLRKLLPIGEELSTGAALDTTLQLVPQDFKSMYKLNEALTIPELDKHIHLLRERGDTTVNLYIVEKYARYMQPFSVLLLTFMGVLVSARKTRGGAGFLIALGALISFIYIIFFVLVKSMAEVGSMPPLLAIWMPNIIFGIVALLFYRFASR